MPFVAGPNLSYIGNGLYITVGESEYVGTDDVIRIPSDFRTDLASVPRLFWWLLPPSGVYERAAVAHDFLCDELARAYRNDTTARIDSRSTDGLFRRICREAGVSPFLYWQLWWGVRIGALANPARRPGSLRTLPAVLVLTVVNVAAAYGAWWASSALFGLLFW